MNDKITIKKNIAQLIIRKHLSSILILIILFILIIFFSVKSENFLDSRNIIAIFFSVSSIGIVCLGQTLLLIAGMFDISVGSMVGFAGVILAKIFITLEVNNPGQTYLKERVSPLSGANSSFNIQKGLFLRLIMYLLNTGAIFI